MRAECIPVCCGIFYSNVRIKIYKFLVQFTNKSALSAHDPWSTVQYPPPHPSPNPHTVHEGHICILKLVVWRIRNKRKIKSTLTLT